MKADKQGNNWEPLIRVMWCAALVLVMLSPLTAKADCTMPAGVEAEMYYNTTYKRVQFCDGTNWINMGVSFAGTVDNLGNHTATQALDMGGFAITGAGAVTGASFTGSGSALTALNASNLGSGTIPNARFPATLPAVSGVNLTSLNASNLASGTVPTARLGTGTADATTFLRGDGTWATIPAGADNLGDHTATQTLVLGTNWINGDSGAEGISVNAAGGVRMDYGNATYDVWIQGGAGTSGVTRRLALLGREDTGVLYLNYASEYAGGVQIGGPITITAGSLSDNSIVAADIAANAITSTQLANDAVTIAKLAATGTPSATTFLRGDNTWATPAAGGGVASRTTVNCANTTGQCIATCASGWFVSGCAGMTTPAAQFASSDPVSTRPSGNGCECVNSASLGGVTCYAFCLK